MGSWSVLEMSQPRAVPAIRMPWRAVSGDVLHLRSFQPLLYSARGADQSIFGSQLTNLASPCHPDFTTEGTPAAETIHVKAAAASEDGIKAPARRSWSSELRNARQLCEVWKRIQCMEPIT